jgi:ubiquinone/menaquinone biosynthesis C-methylase UbiE
MSSRLEREKTFHDNRFGNSGDDRSRVTKYHDITRFSTEYYKRLVLDLCRGAKLLEYGCGRGSLAFIWAKNGATVTGIDISDEGIRYARERAEREGLQISFVQMNAENMEFEADSFDIITGTGIIHHLELESAFSELARVLHKDGHAIFVEPLGHNAIINLYRKLTPSLRTEDEHPLCLQDLATGKKYFGNLEAKYFYIFTLLAVPFRRFFFYDALLEGLYALDNGLIRVFPFLGRYCWIVVIHLQNPK